jgi:aminomethyltransferase
MRQAVRRRRLENRTMDLESPFAAAKRYQPVQTVSSCGVGLATRFAEAAAEYRAAKTQAALFDRSDRGLLIASGSDRKDWLHNLVTNAVKTLDDNTGNYAFAVDVKGRVQFDLNILSMPDSLWLDIDLAASDAAKEHLERYLITEDVQLESAGGRTARLGCAGPQAVRAAERLGIPSLTSMAALSSFSLAEGGARLVRHDFAGLVGFELYVARNEAARWWDRLVEECGATPAGASALDALRIEAGIPWLGRDIDERVLPAETGQIERGISYHKGCYLGQEIIERMRSRGSLANRLVKITMDDGAGLELPAALRKDAAEVGRVTSLIRHPDGRQWIGLGYLRTTVVDFGDVTVGGRPRSVLSIEPASA